MKFVLVAVALVGGLCMVQASVDESSVVTAQFSSVNHVLNDLQSFTNQQLDKSFDFLLLSFTFNKYDLDRPGFEKLYRKISDKAWEDTQKLIKYQSKRGLTVNLNGVEGRILNQLFPSDKTVKTLLESSEQSSLKLALDYEKLLADESHRIHKKISHAHPEKLTEYDPDVAHFLDEEVIEYQSGTLRKLSGYIHNLKNILGEEHTKNLGLKMFDEYLEKVE